MGSTYVWGTLRGTTGVSERVRFHVDSGATYSLVPRDVWKRLGLQPLRRVGFVLADGTEMERDVGECWMELEPEGQGTSPMILGEPGDSALLGVVTLEVMGLVLNPFKRSLHPMRMLA